MKCLKCGKENNEMICEECLNNDAVLGYVFYEIMYYNPEKCENRYISDFAGKFSDKKELQKACYELLTLFPEEQRKYYYCRYLAITHDQELENAALSYIEHHNIEDKKTQRVLWDLLNTYLRKDFIKPLKWCQIISETKDLHCELYRQAAQFFSMVGDYDLSDKIVNIAIEYCKNSEYDKFLFSNAEKLIEQLEQQKIDTCRYREVKPYWPKNEDARQKLSEIYADKGIEIMRITAKAKKIPESEFEPIKECFDNDIKTYCSFWCSESFSLSVVKDIYEIAAVRVENGIIKGTFQSFIKPWNGGENARKDAAKKAGVMVDVIASAEDVDQVIPKFFAFVGSDVLLSTGALGNQCKLLSRAARYSGMKKIENQFFDLLDFAADTDSKFDLANNTREYLLSYFKLEEGKNSLDKAKINIELFKALRNFGV